MNDLLAGVASGLETAFEPGDRVELTVTDEPDRLLVPPTAWPAAGGEIDAIEDANGAPLCATFDHAVGCLSLIGLGELIQDRWPSFWLEYRGPGHFRLVVEDVPPPPESEDLTTDQGVPVHPDPDDRLFLLGASRSSARLVEFQLAFGLSS